MTPRRAVITLSDIRGIIFLAAALLSARGPSVAQEDYEKWKTKEEQKFQQFVEERDREFAAFLKNEWTHTRLAGGLTPFQKPKPTRLPVRPAPEEPPPEVSADTFLISGVPPDTGTGSQKHAPPVQLPISPGPNGTRLSVPFFGHRVAITYDKSARTSLEVPPREGSISRFWDRLSRSDYRDLLSQTSYYVRLIGLNDWGFLELCHAIGMGIYASENEAILLTWFLASKSGFLARVGYSGNQVCLLTATDNTLFGVPFLRRSADQRRYYVLSLDPAWKLVDEQISTYDGDYPGAIHPVSFSVGVPPTMEDSAGGKTLRFSFRGEEHVIPVKFSKDAVHYFENYPQSNLEVYFDASPSAEASGSLITAFRPLVRGKTEKEAVSLLLRFVQTAFRYKTDPEQFGREKPLFPDETLYYEYSDCEDRAVLFAFLVRKLTGLEVIGLDYPDHIATAVRFNGGVGGDEVRYGGRTYSICDPTYENAGAGECMPALRAVEPKIIRVE